MTGLSDDANALVRLGREAGPDAASLARVRGALLAAVGSGAAVGAATAAAKGASIVPQAAAGTATTTTILGTVAKALSVVAVIGSGIAAVHVHAEPQPAKATARLGAAPTPRTSSEAQFIGSAPPTLVSSASPPETTTSSRTDQDTVIPTIAVYALPSAPPTPVGRGTAPKRSAPVEASAPMPGLPAPTSFATDLSHLRGARQAIAAGQPERALAAVAGIPDDSPLAEERDAVRAIARCTSARGTIGALDVARQELERFSREHPTAALGSRVTRACSDVP